MGRFKYIVSLLLIGFLAVGCSSKKSGGSGAGFDDGDGGGGDGTTPPITDPSFSGSTVDFIPASSGTMSEFLGKDVDATSKFKLVVKLRKYGTYARAGGGVDFGFGGYVTIQSEIPGGNYNDTFTSMANPGAMSYANTNKENHQYNLYTVDYPEMGGKPGYHGFFQDGYGAIILVVDNFKGSNDGDGATTGNGHLYYKNWKDGAQPLQLQWNSSWGYVIWGPLSPTSCWFVRTGPYDCRAWKNGDWVATKRSIYPDNNYVYLGSFNGLKIKTAFDGEI